MLGQVLLMYRRAQSAGVKGKVRRNEGRKVCLLAACSAQGKTTAGSSSAMGVVEFPDQGRQHNLLSNGVVVMARVHLEGAVVSPEVHRAWNAGDAALVYLRALSERIQKRDPENVPSQPSRYHQSRIPNRHISSSIQRIAGIWRGSSRTRYGLARWQTGSSCA